MSFGQHSVEGFGIRQDCQSYRAFWIWAVSASAKLIVTPIRSVDPVAASAYLISVQIPPIKASWSLPIGMGGLGSNNRRGFRSGWKLIGSP
jgi:hypothetical protein